MKAVPTHFAALHWSQSMRELYNPLQPLHKLLCKQEHPCDSVTCFTSLRHYGRPTLKGQLSSAKAVTSLLSRKLPQYKRSCLGCMNSGQGVTVRITCISHICSESPFYLICIYSFLYIHFLLFYFLGYAVTSPFPTHFLPTYVLYFNTVTIMINSLWNTHEMQ